MKKVFFLFLVLLASLFSCTYYEIEINENCPTDNEHDIHSEIMIIEISYYPNEDSLYTSEFPQKVSVHDYWIKPKFDNEVLEVHLLKNQFVKTHSVYVEDCQPDWFYTYYYTDKFLVFFLEGTCFSTVELNHFLTFTLEIEINE